MKAILALLLSIFLIGPSMAVTLTETPVQKWGPNPGFLNYGTIQAGDLYATDDIKIGDDAEVGGDLAVTGAISAGAGTISSGVYDGNFRLAANHWLYSTTGTGGIDWSNATGTFKSPTGVNTFGGIGLFPSTLYVVGTSALNYTTVTDIRASDDGYITDAFGVGGTAGLNYTTVTDIRASDDAYITDALAAGGTSALNYTTVTDIRASDDGYFTDDVGIGGTAAFNETTSTTDVVSGHSHLNQTYTAGLVDSGTANLNATRSTTIVASGTSYLNGTIATDVRATDDALVDDDFFVDGTATLNDAAVNTTLDVNGATTTAGITVDTWSTITAGQFKRATNTTATNITILDNGADVYLVGNGTGVNTQTVNFPTAADNKGRIITVILATDPLANSVILDGEGGETIDTAATKTTTDAVGSMYHLICNGAAWIKLASLGTWS